MPTTGTDHRSAGDVALGEQFANHDGWRPAGIDALAGRRIQLRSPAGLSHLTFESSEQLIWSNGASDLWPSSEGSASYEALSLRAGWIAVITRPHELRSTFLAVHTESGRGLAVVTRLDVGHDGVQEHTDYVQVAIDSPDAEPVRRTDSLAGRRIQWRYSDTHVFEHIYLNPTAYCWHGLAGPEQWIGDVDPYVAYELADELFLFAWSETVVPFNGIAVLDLIEWKSAGRFFGWDTDRRCPEQIIVGAEGLLLNVTQHQL